MERRLGEGRYRGELSQGSLELFHTPRPLGIAPTAPPVSFRLTFPAHFGCTVSLPTLKMEPTYELEEGARAVLDSCDPRGPWLPPPYEPAGLLRTLSSPRRDDPGGEHI